MGHFTEPIRSWSKADDIMERKGTRRTRRFQGQRVVRLGYNTYLTVDQERNYGILLHDTQVMRFTREGSTYRVRFHTGGWETVTTLQTMQKHSPHCISVSGRDILSPTRPGVISVRYGDTEDLLSLSGGPVTITLAPEDVRYE